MLNKLVRITVAVYMCVAVSSLSYSQGLGCEFLNAPRNSRLNAMGGDGVSLSSDISGASRANPALINGGMHKEGNVTYLNYLAGQNWGGIEYSHSFKEANYWDWTLDFSPSGKIDQTDEFGQNIGSYSALDIAMGGAYSRDLHPKFRVGIGMELIYSHIADYHAFGFSFDIGCLYHNEDKGIGVGLAFRNIGAQIVKYSVMDDSRDRLPFDMAIGVSKKLDHAPLRFTLTYNNINRWDLSYAKYNIVDKATLNDKETSGIEKIKWGDMFFRHWVLCVEFIPVKAFGVTVGYNARRGRESQMSESRSGGGFCFGLDVHVRKVNVGASYAIYGKAANVLGVTMSYKFEESAERVKPIDKDKPWL